MRFGHGVLLLLSAAIIAMSLACSGGGNDHKFSPEVRKTFLDTCTSSGGNDKQCKCALGKLEDKYSEEQFKDLERRITAGEAAAETELGPIASSCR